MGLFSLDWFKSNRETKQKVEEIEEKIEKLDAEIAIHILHKQDQPGRPYKKVKLVNDVVTVILNDGSIITKSNATSDDFMAIRHAATETEVLSLMIHEGVKKETIAYQEKVDDARAAEFGLSMVIDHDDFETRDNAVYMKGINRSIPEMLVKEFARLIGQGKADTEQYESLKKFWLKCCLNPNAQSAEDLYTFLSNHKFKIDRHGNFYAYRRVVSRKTDVDKELVEFIANTYHKIKAVWKKNPANFIIDKDKNGEYNFYHYAGEGYYKGLGILKDLYLNLPSMAGNSYTDAHTHSFDYRVGEIASMPRHLGNDDNTVSCSKGFHAASKAYDYSGFGDTPILMIINPMDVLAVPQGEVGKLRTCRWFFATPLREDERYILDDEEFDVSDLGDVFEDKCIKDLTEHVQNSFAEEVQRHTFQLPTLSATELSNIVSSLELMKKAISKRVNVIK